jgi:hypothetical protein
VLHGKFEHISIDQCVGMPLSVGANNYILVPTLLLSEARGSGVPVEMPPTSGCLRTQIYTWIFGYKLICFPSEIRLFAQSENEELVETAYCH